MNTVLIPHWPAPAQIKAYSTTRSGGNSTAPYDQFNLAMHVGDDKKNVQKNREHLKKIIHLPSEPCWLTQIHGRLALPASDENRLKEADASFTQKSETVCAVLTADCLPILICDKNATCVAAIHAGWKGLAAGIIENTLEKMGKNPGELLVWLGPAIGPEAFEVGEDVFSTFCNQNPAAILAFQEQKNKKWLANIYLLAKQRFAALNVRAIYSENYCTYTDKSRFYSYRREKTTGRMASLIWISK